MRLKLAAILLSVLCIAALLPISADVQADAPISPIQNNEGLPGLPFTYSGTNGGAEALTLNYTSNFLPAAASEGAPIGTSGILSIAGATPGGAGLLAVSLAPADIQGFGLSFLIATDPVNLLTYYTFGYSALGSLVIPNVSQNYPFLAGINTYLQAYEYAPGAKCSNGLVFPLL